MSKLNAKNGLGVFISQTFRKFIEVGALCPSSQFLAKRITAPISAKENITVVELGAGTGSLTKVLLKKMPAKSRLFAFEINEALAKHLKNGIRDPRLYILTADARNLSAKMANLGIKRVDYVISGLPLGNFSTKNNNIILSEINKILAPGGEYVQFQYFLSRILTIRKYFKIKKVSFEARNLPPAFVIECEKARN